MDDLISRSDAIGAVKEERFPIDSDYAEGFMAALDKVEWILKEWLPSAQPEIIRCNDCKHWTQTTGNMRGFGLGDCDYINAKLVNCNGFCSWAERRTDGN